MPRDFWIYSFLLLTYIVYIPVAYYKNIRAYDLFTNAWIRNIYIGALLWICCYKDYFSWLFVSWIIYGILVIACQLHFTPVRAVALNKVLRCGMRWVCAIHLFVYLDLYGISDAPTVITWFMPFRAIFGAFFYPYFDECPTFVLLVMTADSFIQEGGIIISGACLWLAVRVKQNQMPIHHFFLAHFAHFITWARLGMLYLFPAYGWISDIFFGGLFFFCVGWFLNFAKLLHSWKNNDNKKL